MAVRLANAPARSQNRGGVAEEGDWRGSPNERDSAEPKGGSAKGLQKEKKKKKKKKNSLKNWRIMSHHQIFQVVKEENRLLKLQRAGQKGRYVPAGRGKESGRDKNSVAHRGA